MKKKQLKVIFKKDKEGNIIAFLPDIEVNFGNIMSYAHDGQHSETDIEYYWSLKKAEQEEYKSLLNELKMIYNDYDILIRQRLQTGKLNWRFEQC